MVAHPLSGHAVSCRLPAPRRIATQAKPARVATATPRSASVSRDRSAAAVIAAAPLAAGGDWDVGYRRSAGRRSAARRGRRLQRLAGAALGQGRLVPGLSPAAAGARRRRPPSAPTRLYDRLTHDEFKRYGGAGQSRTRPVAALTGRLRTRGHRLSAAARDFYSDDFSNGIENILDRLAVRLQLAGVRAHREAEGLSLERLAARSASTPGRRRRGTRSRGSPMRPAGWSGRPSATTRFCRSPTTAAGRANRVEIRADEATEGQAIVPYSRRRAGAGTPAPAGSIPVGANAAATDKVTYRCSPRRSMTAPRWRPADFLYPLCAGVPLGRGPRRQDLRSGDRGGDGG